MQPIDALHQRSQQAKQWLNEQAFPFWEQHGPHPAWGFCEQLDLASLSSSLPCSRVRVQARQTFCFALACQFGRENTAPLIRRGVEALLEHCRRPDGLYGQEISFDKGPKPGPIELYDSAFVLLALSWAAHMLDDAQIARAASTTGQLIDEQLSHQAGGYCERLPASPHRQQNPHMHLFEASLAHADFSGDQASIQRCANIAALMQSRFCDQQGRLREIFDPDWNSHADDHLEAGHQFEWVWLLAQWQKLSGSDLANTRQSLYATGLSLTADDGRLALSHHLDGRVRDARCRCWSQTEALKAHLSQIRAGDQNAINRAITSFDLLMTDHLAPAPPGAWIDITDLHGRALSRDIPASTGYHLFLALTELIRFVDTF